MLRTTHGKLQTLLQYATSDRGKSLNLSHQLRQEILLSSSLATYTAHISLPSYTKGEVESCALSQREPYKKNTP